MGNRQRRRSHCFSSLMQGGRAVFLCLQSKGARQPLSWERSGASGEGNQKRQRTRELVAIGATLPV